MFPIGENCHIPRSRRDMQLEDQVLVGEIQSAARSLLAHHSLVFCVVYIVLLFLLMVAEHSGVEPTCDVEPLKVYQAPRAGYSV